MNTLISESLLVKELFSDSGEKSFFIFDFSSDDLSLSANIKLNEDFIISEENYNVIIGNEVSLTLVKSEPYPLKRWMNGSINEIQIQQNLDLETNKINNTSTTVKTRPLQSNEVVDKDGNVYTTVKIGNQHWMAEDLRTSLFNDSTAIPFLNPHQWATSNSSGIIKNNESGFSYTYFTLVDQKKLCPTGFHVPTHKDIRELYNNITPNGDKVKITKKYVKEKVYPSILAPIIVPVSFGAHLAIHSIISVPLLVIDAAILGPIFGWKSIKSQKKKDIDMAKLYESQIDSNKVYKLKYTMCPLTNNISDCDITLLEEFQLFPISPYKKRLDKDFSKNSKKIINKPVITQLLEKGNKNQYSDQFGFHLNINNEFLFCEVNKGDYIRKDQINSYGLFYLNHKIPAIWGDSYNYKEYRIKSQLNINNSPSELLLINGDGLKKMSTPVRCVND